MVAGATGGAAAAACDATAASMRSRSSRAMAGSVSWMEWTQQLQAYIAWVNSQLRKRPGLGPVQDLRTDLQSGETLAQLIEIICEYRIVNLDVKEYFSSASVISGGYFFVGFIPSVP